VSKKVIGIVGSYRKGRIIDTAISAVLDGAQAGGAETKKVYLLDKHIEFCTNCRNCTQRQIDGVRDRCVVHNDDMEQILDEIDSADGIVLGSPINFFSVTALIKRFIERLLPYSYWPWGSLIPKFRIKKPSKKAVIIISSGCPAWLGRLFFRSVLGVLKGAAKCMGAKVVKSFYFGCVCLTEDQQLSEGTVSAAQKAGQKLVS
jgi:NAD(P)H-dependent FMN reductase